MHWLLLDDWELFLESTSVFNMKFNNLHINMTVGMFIAITNNCVDLIPFGPFIDKCAVDKKTMDFFVFWLFIPEFIQIIFLHLQENSNMILNICFIEF